jgi:hypothetical protein
LDSFSIHIHKLTLHSASYVRVNNLHHHRYNLMLLEVIEKYQIDHNYSPLYQIKGIHWNLCLLIRNQQTSKSFDMNPYHTSFWEMAQISHHWLQKRNELLLSMLSKKTIKYHLQKMKELVIKLNILDLGSMGPHIQMQCLNLVPGQSLKMD